MIKQSLKKWIAVPVLCSFAIVFQSCGEKPNEHPNEKEQTASDFDLTSAKAEIEQANRDFMALVAAGDSVGIANSYTSDAKVMFAGAPAVVGRAKIQTVFYRILNSGVTRISLKTKAVFGTEDLLAEEGEVTVYVKDRAVAEEKYIILWKKVNGEWKLFRDIANSNSPAK